MQRAALGLVLLLVQLSAQGPAPPLVPAVALDAAAKGAVPLAYVLARSGVPAGLVTTENPSEAAYSWTADRLSEPGTVATADALARLRQAHPHYRTTWSGSVLSIADPAAPCNAPLDEPLKEPLSAEGDLSRVLLLLAWATGDRTTPPRGSVGPVPGPPGAPRTVTPLPASKVAVPAGATLRRAFNEAVSASRGGVWIVWQHTRPDGRIGCRSVGFYPNGQVGASDTDFRVVER